MSVLTRSNRKWRVRKPDSCVRMVFLYLNYEANAASKWRTPEKFSFAAKRKIWTEFMKFWLREHSWKDQPNNPHHKRITYKPELQVRNSDIVKIGTKHKCVLFQFLTQITPTLRKEKRPIEISETSDSYTSSIRRSKRQIKKEKKNSDQQTQSIIHDIQDTRDCSTELHLFDAILIGTVSPGSPKERWAINPNPNIPYTVTEVEQQSDNS